MNIPSTTTVKYDTDIDTFLVASVSDPLLDLEDLDLGGKRKSLYEDERSHRRQKRVTYDIAAYAVNRVKNHEIESEAL
jgi:hypothetical protein